MARNGLEMRLFVGRWRCLAGWVALRSERGAVGCGTPMGTREVLRMCNRQIDLPRAMCWGGGSTLNTQRSGKGQHSTLNINDPLPRLTRLLACGLNTQHSAAETGSTLNTQPLAGTQHSTLKRGGRVNTQHSNTHDRGRVRIMT